MITAISQEMIPAIWTHCEPNLQKAVGESNGELTIEGVLETLLSGAGILIAMYNGGEIVANAMIEKRIFKSGLATLNITLVGGTMIEEWADDFIDIMDKIAAEQGCSEVRGMGRKGWARYLKSKGYKHAHTVMIRKL